MQLMRETHCIKKTRQQKNLNIGNFILWRKSSLKNCTEQTKTYKATFNVMWN